MTTINVAVVRPDATPWPYAVVTVRLVDAGSGGAVEEHVIAGWSTIHCDVDGEGTIDLTPNADISPAGTYYAFAVEQASPATVRCIEVPDSPTPISWADESIQVLPDTPPVFIPAPNLASVGFVPTVNETGDAYELQEPSGGGGGGAGDVVGPASSTNNSLARFDGTTGKLLKDGLAVGTGAGTVAAGDDARFSDARTPNVAGSNDDFMQRKAGAWTYRTPAQVAADLTTLAPLASPALTGNPTAPTQAAADNSTKIATTAYVDTADGLLVPKSLIDAKGDLLVGTADNTVARLAVGADGLPLIADSTATPGVAFHTPTIHRGYYRDSESYLLNRGPIVLGGATNVTPGANKILWWDIEIVEPIKFDAQWLYSQTTNTGAKGWPGIWAKDPTTGQPTGLPLVTGAEINLTSTAYRSDTFTKSGWIMPGIYAGGWATNDGTAGIRPVTASNNVPILDMGGASGAVAGNLSWTSTWTYSSSALPDVTSHTFVASTTIPSPFIRWRTRRS